MTRAPVLLFLAFATTAAAQPQERHQIAVRQSEDGRQCEYEISGQEDQALFAVAPGGEVQFQPRGGFLVKVTVQPDPSGIEGGEGVREMWISNSRPRPFPVRADLNRVTEHEVVIECCTNRNRSRTCPDGQLVRATAPQELIGSGSAVAPASQRSGPSADGAPPVPMRVPMMGPRMRVQD